MDFDGWQSCVLNLPRARGVRKVGESYHKDPPAGLVGGFLASVPPPAGTEALPLEFPLATFALEGESRPRNDLTCRSECDLSKSVYNLNIH